MKWITYEKNNGWKRRFAFFPLCFREAGTKEWIWLEWYWSRFEGLYTAISQEEPTEEL